MFFLITLNNPKYKLFLFIIGCKTAFRTICKHNKLM